MKFWDANCLIGTPPCPTLRHFETAEDLLREMDDLHIDHAVVCEFQAFREPQFGNEALMKKIAGHDRLIPAWIVTPHAQWQTNADRDLLKAVDDADIRIVRIQPGPARRFNMSPWVMDDLYAGLAECNVTVYVDFVIEDRLTHAAVPVEQWDALYALARAHPTLKIIVFAKKLSTAKAQLFPLMARCPNVYIDVSAFQSWLATELLTERFGADRQVFGSYLPFYDPGQFMLQVTCAGIDDAQKHQIAAGNLARLLRLEAD